MLRYIINGVELDFWLVVTPTLATVMMKKALDNRPIDRPFDAGGAEKYPVFSVTCNGECFRHSGLPVGWGLKLTKDRKIKEIR